MKAKSKDTVHAAANAIELVTGVVHVVSGTAVGNTINGQKASRSALSQLVASRLQARFSSHTSKAVK